MSEELTIGPDGLIYDEHGRRVTLIPTHHVVTVDEQWEVVGDPGHGYPPYHFVFNNENSRGEHSAEERARAMVKLCHAAHGGSWVEGPSLRHRTVTSFTSEWELRE